MQGFNEWLMRLAYVDGQMQLAQLDVEMDCVTWTMFDGYCGGWILQYPKKWRDA
jgi:hypothetical protein